jgi:hypothetical protein
MSLTWHYFRKLKATEKNIVNQLHSHSSRAKSTWPDSTRRDDATQRVQHQQSSDCCPCWQGDVLTLTAIKRSLDGAACAGPNGRCTRWCSRRPPTIRMATRGRPLCRHLDWRYRHIGDGGPLNSGHRTAPHRSAQKGPGGKQQRIAHCSKALEPQRAGCRFATQIFSSTLIRSHSIESSAFSCWNTREDRVMAPLALAVSYMPSESNVMALNFGAAGLEWKSR